ncbi:MAG: hypothetical protein AMXMBFR47_28050 [Planctomycetota bacterium]
MRRTADDKREKPRFPWLYALPGGVLPRAVRCNGQRFEHVQTFKHDFFAATGVYRGPDGGLAVLKLGRRTRFLTLPAAWIGRFLTRREARMYAKLQGMRGIPRFIGVVGRNAGFLHEFIPGHPLGRDERVSETFFDELLAMVKQLHSMNIAYVDLNKRQNILMGDDGRPWLIDFQISLDIPPTGWGRLWPARWLLARFQHGDWYHCLKHKRRLRPDLLTEAERGEVERLSLAIRIHRAFARPLTHLRRAILARLKRSETAEVVGSSAK